LEEEEEKDTEVFYGGPVCIFLFFCLVRSLGEDSYPFISHKTLNGASNKHPFAKKKEKKEKLFPVCD